MSDEDPRSGKLGDGPKATVIEHLNKSPSVQIKIRFPTVKTRFQHRKKE